MAVEAFTTIGALLADRSRATVLVALMDGRARTAGELARHAQVAPSTISEHLARLVDAGMIETAAQGKHRYFRIANDDVGLMLETVGGIELTSKGPDAPLSRAPQELRYARSCYDHLAGELAVRIHDRLIANGHLERVDGTLGFTSAGHALFRDLEVSTRPADTRRAPVRPCLDWTERRDHLAGPAAAGLFQTMLSRRWITRGARPRSIRVTSTGLEKLTGVLGI
jgi:DNA-binding transcriptional ArsR family regulator